MHEEQDSLLAPRSLRQFAVHLGDKGRIRALDDRIQHREVFARIGRQALGPLQLAHLMVGWHRHIDRGKGQVGRALTRDERPRNFRRLTRRGNENAVARHVRHPFRRERRVVDPDQFWRLAKPGKRLRDQSNEKKYVAHQIAPLFVFVFVFVFARWATPGSRPTPPPSSGLRPIAVPAGRIRQGGPERRLRLMSRHSALAEFGIAVVASTRHLQSRRTQLGLARPTGFTHFDICKA